MPRPESRRGDERPRSSTSTERRQSPEADAKARDLRRRRPQDPQAHFALSYVLRYAGLLEEAGAGMRRRPGRGPAQPRFRSCAFVFAALGKYERAREYLRSDAGSDWTKAREGNILQREGKIEAAAALLRPRDSSWRSQPRPQVRHDRPSGTGSRRHGSGLGFDPDPGIQYYVGGYLAVVRLPRGGTAPAAQGRRWGTTSPPRHGPAIRSTIPSARGPSSPRSAPKPSASRRSSSRAGASAP